MKTVFYLIAAALLTATTSHAAVVAITFGWDPNTETYLAGYTLHVSDTAGGPYSEVSDFGRDDTEGTVTVQMEPNTSKYFVLTAWRVEPSFKESGYSNEGPFFLPLDAGDPAPAAPSFRVMRWEVVSYE